MARKHKQSPYDSSAGAGTGHYLTESPGASIERAGAVRAMPGPPGNQEAGLGPPSSTLFGAVVVTVFCFFPLGLFAVFYALQVRPRWKRGDESGARHAAQMAEKLTFAAVGMAVIVAVIAGLSYVVYWFFVLRNSV
ncbi:MAG: CD225/dispanin family protein [Actinobacteria bacterium]|nr:CD225/dispanin family protein [Actinomycetota bacterium]